MYILVCTCFIRVHPVSYHEHAIPFSAQSMSLRTAIRSRLYSLCNWYRQCYMVFFSTFEELKLPISGLMERAGVTELYEPFPTPCLYVAPAARMVGRVPLIPLFLAGNSTPTIPHQYSQHKRSGFPVGSCDTAEADGRRGSNVYEVNPWLWQFGRGKPRLGGLSGEKTGARKEAAQKERLQRGVETCRRRKADRA